MAYKKSLTRRRIELNQIFIKLKIPIHFTKWTSLPTTHLWQLSISINTTLPLPLKDTRTFFLFIFVFDFNLRASDSNIFNMNAKGLALSISFSSSFQPHYYSHSLSWWCKTLQDQMKKKVQKGRLGLLIPSKLLELVSIFLNVRIVIAFQLFIWFVIGDDL